ncbi:Vitamin B12 transporter BtuB [Chryseobacterium oranimense G311]|nr:Vitamin B12 transporter BtuB [Chryseobacterium oranimense G311]
MKGLFFLGLTVGAAAFIQAQNKDSLKVREIEAVNFTKRLPVAKEIINVQKDVDSRNLGQDLPILLKNQTSIISTSDAGNGVGYTGFRIRGVEGKGINVMMNGVPYNDSESQGTFFVNVPDLTSSASQIVIQRGVGTSNNGVSAFGASINVISKEPEEKMYFKTDDSYGSFNTYKYSAEAGSGKFWKDRLSVMGRYTRIHSDGYIDRAFSKLDSYNFTALFEEGKTRLRLMASEEKKKHTRHGTASTGRPGKPIQSSTIQGNILIWLPVRKNSMIMRRIIISRTITSFYGNRSLVITGIWKQRFITPKEKDITKTIREWMKPMRMLPITPIIICRYRS